MHLVLLPPPSPFQGETMKAYFLLGCVVSLLFASEALADLVSFRHQGIGTLTGTLDGEPFETSRTTITGVADTDDRIEFAPRIYYIQHQSTSIEIEGIGVYETSTPIVSFVNQIQEGVGLSRIVPGSFEDFFYGPSSMSFSSWEMLNSIGPINDDEGYFFERDGMETPGGSLVIHSATLQSTNFVATVIPEPSPWVLILTITIASNCRRRRNK